MKREHIVFQILTFKGTWYTSSPKTAIIMFCFIIFFSFLSHLSHFLIYHVSKIWMIYFFDQGSVDGKGEARVEKYHLVAELKFKMLNLQKVAFPISTLPPGVTFELWTHYSHLWTLSQKHIIQIFDTLCIYKFH